MKTFLNMENVKRRIPQTTLTAMPKKIHNIIRGRDGNPRFPYQGRGFVIGAGGGI